MMNIHVERIKRARPSGDTWQAGVVRIPMWTQGEDGRPERPYAGLCVSMATGFIHATELREGQAPSPELVLEALGGLAAKKEFRGGGPGRIEVRDAALAEHLSAALTGTGIAVVHSVELAALDIAVDDLTEHMLDGQPDRAALKVPDVTIAHLRAFAEAAKELYEARPWRYLWDVDLIRVELPAAPRGLGCLTVMGAGGREFGLAFFGSPRDHEQMLAADDPLSYFTHNGAWSLTFCTPDYLPFGDADAWEDQRLPVAGPDAYPLLAWFGPKKVIRRPTAAEWAWVEGVARAIARTTEAELDTGRWRKSVETIEGPREFILTLPALLEPPGESPPRRSRIPDLRVMERTLRDLQRAAGEREFESVEQFNEFVRENYTDGAPPHAPPRTPLEAAQDLMYEAFAAQGRRCVQLARQALEISPDCADAYVVLAEHAADVEDSYRLYEQGVAAGARALGAQTFEEDAGYFWGNMETRPYMRARDGLAWCCEELGRIDEAIGHYEALLQLNPSDNLGARYSLATCLLRRDNLERLGALLKQYPEGTAHWDYLWALWAFRKYGDTPEARHLLGAAHKANRHVRKYLLGNAPMPDEIPDAFHPGDDSEAVVVADELAEVWRATPGASAWLAEGSKPASAGPRKRRRRR